MGLLCHLVIAFSLSHLADCVSSISPVRFSRGRIHNNLGLDSVMLQHMVLTIPQSSSCVSR